MKNNVIIYLHHEHGLLINDGGTVAMFNFARLLEKYGKNVRMYVNSYNKTENPIFYKYYENDFPIDDNCVVVYCEGTKGNPLNAKYVVRWMLSELGQNVPYSNLNTWSKNELVYYFNSETKFEKNPEKIGKIYKLLTTIYLNPNIEKKNNGIREGFCYTMRKALLIHKTSLFIEHPPNSFEITREHNPDDCVKIFNNYKFFLCYDPLTFLIIISAICGCIPIVHKIKGLSKQEWIQKTAASEYLKYKGLNNLYGIAYGKEDIEYARSTLHLVKDQWNDIINFCNEKTVIPFIEDIQNFENMQNTIQNNY
jgi:hypothetical protein